MTGSSFLYTRIVITALMSPLQNVNGKLKIKSACQ